MMLHTHQTVKESFEQVCICVSVCVCVMLCNAPGGWTRWPSRCVGGSKPWQTDTMGTVFKEDTQIHKHMHTISQRISDEKHNFSNHCQFIRVFKGSPELRNSHGLSAFDYF